MASVTHNFEDEASSSNFFGAQSGQTSVQLNYNHTMAHKKWNIQALQRMIDGTVLERLDSISAVNGGQLNCAEMSDRPSLQ